MCVGFWTLDHPDYALILCSNRDEYLHRPTAPAQWHSFGPVSADDNGEGSVLSGRDLLAGGTWAGVNSSGRVVLLTNVTEPPRKYTSSRGDLTSFFLLPKAPQPMLQAEIDAFLDTERDRAYAGFNMLVLSPSPAPDPLKQPAADPGSHGISFDGAFITNSGGGGTITARMLSDDERRCGGMSNGVEDRGSSEWPKVRLGKQRSRDILHSLPRDATEAEIAERLFALLTWKCEPPPVSRTELRNTIEVEPLLVPSAASTATTDEGPTSKIYYGTRLATVILIRPDGHVTFIERDIWTLDSEEGGEGVVKRDSEPDRVFRFQIPSNPR